ncbi:MAG TPA: hypothetical protein VLG49_05505, partial [Rhabdochlamydiaceae bacterium]|nr:hypothetical protein [Rhabdochlamydiaceae bacterium]
MSGNMRHAHVPCDPLEIQSASPNRVLVGRLCAALASSSLRLSCGSILFCALNPSAAARVPSQTCRFGPLPRRAAVPFCFHSRIKFYKYARP